MDNNQFNNVNNNSNVNIPVNDGANNSIKKSRGILAILLGICIIGIIIFIVIFIGMITPEKEKDNGNNNETNIPSESEETLKKRMVVTINNYISAATTGINDMKFGTLNNIDTLHFIPVSNIKKNSCIHLEKGGEDPFGEWGEAYVVVKYNPELYSYDYYFTFYDKAGYGMKLTKADLINPNGDDIIKSNEINDKTILRQRVDGITKAIIFDTPAQNSEYNCKFEL